MRFTEAYSISRALSNAWQLIFAAPAALLVGGALLMLLDGHYQFGIGGDEWGDFGDRRIEAWLAPFVTIFIAFGCLLGLFFFIATSWLHVGFANAVEETARTGQDRIAAVFDAKNRWLSMALVRLLRGAVLVLGLVPFLPIVLFGVLLHEGFDLPEELAAVAALVGALLYLPVLIYIALGLALVVPVVALEGLDPFAASRRSWSLVRGNRFWLLLYGIVLALVELSGLLLCCIGIFFTSTLARAAWTDSYLALTRGDDYLDGFFAKAQPASPTPSVEPEAEVTAEDVRAEDATSMPASETDAAGEDGEAAPPPPIP